MCVYICCFRTLWMSNCFFDYLLLTFYSSKYKVIFCLQKLQYHNVYKSEKATIYLVCNLRMHFALKRTHQWDQCLLRNWLLFYCSTWLYLKPKQIETHRNVIIQICYFRVWNVSILYSLRRNYYSPIIKTVFREELIGPNFFLIAKFYFRTCLVQL